jgi:hypothetical protein
MRKNRRFLRENGPVVQVFFCSDLKRLEALPGWGNKPVMPLNYHTMMNLTLAAAVLTRGPWNFCPSPPPPFLSPTI